MDDLRSAAEAASSVLLELELDPTRELLEQASLTGVTAERWNAASAALLDAWAAQAELEAVIAEAGALRGRRQREALGHLAPDALLARLRAGCDQARACLTDVARAWEVFVPRLQRASDVLAGADRAELARLTASLTADPLGAPVADLDALDAVVAFRLDAPAQLAAARVVLDELRAVAEQTQAAHAAAQEKIARLEVPEPPPLPADLEDGLDGIDSPAALEEWSAHARTLLDELRQILAASRAPLSERDQLRGLLDAYRAKAHALRALEDVGVSESFDRAFRALHTAPTDLQEATRLVHDYRRALSS